MIVKKNIINKYNISHDFINNIFNDCAYIDIEATGLSAQINSIISITIMKKENTKYIMYQLFAACEEDERAVIEYFVNIVKDKKYIVTYNGKSFDLVFLNTKINQYNIDFNINTLTSIDLYKDMQLLNKKLDITNIKLKTAEKFFGIDRMDELSGKDIIRLYDSYKIHKRDEHMELILAHNYEDVFYLPIIFDNILAKYDYITESNILGLCKIINSNIVINNKSIKIKATNIASYNLDYVCNKSTYKLVYKHLTNISKIDLFTSYYSDNKGNYIIYITNEELCLRSFNTINSLQPSIIPLVINNSVLYENLYLIIKKIISCI